MSTDTQTPRRIPPLRSVREAQGLTLRQAARDANLTAAHLSRVERGESMLSIDALYRIATVLGLRQLSDLLDQYRSPQMRVPAVAGKQGTRDNNR